MTQSNRTTRSTTTTPLDGVPVTAKSARSKAADDARQTAQSASEAVRETAHEVAEETKGFLANVGDGITYLAVRTAKEVEKARQAAKPFIRPVLYTGLTVLDPPLGIAVIAMDQGQKVARQRITRLAEMPVVIEGDTVQDSNRS